MDGTVFGRRLALGFPLFGVVLFFCMYRFENKQQENELPGHKKNPYYISACGISTYNKEAAVSCVRSKQTAPLLKDNQYTGGLQEDKENDGTDVDLRADCANTPAQLMSR
jgi:hypothetical protein